MKYFICFIFFSGTIAAFGQTSVKGVVSDQEGHPLPYTNIVSISKQYGTTTDSNGAYQLNNLNINDTVKITNIAYQPILIPVKILRQTDTVFLKEKMVLLDEVVITNFNNFRDKEKIGTLNNKMNWGYAGLAPSGVGMYIENKRRMPGWLKELVFKTTTKGKCRNDFRIRFIGFDTYTGKPTTDLVFENIIIKGKDLKSTNKINLSDYKILMPPGGVVVFFEWLDTDPNCTQTSRITIRGNSKESNYDQMWYNYKDQKWYKMNRPASNGGYPNLNIGLEVAY